MRRRYLATFLAAGALAAGLFFALSSCESGGPVLPYRADLRASPPRAFIIFGDSRRRLKEEFWRSSPDAERLSVIQALADENPDFIVHSGDLVARGTADEWRRFHQENRPVFEKKIPYFPTLGNHEFYGDNEDCLDHYFAAFPGLERRRWYPIRAPPVLIAVLDSNFSELTEGERRDQDQWLTDLLAAAEKDAAVRHVIVVCHHSPYTNARIHGDSAALQEHFVTRKTPKVKAFVTGHVHTYERFLKDGVQYVVSGGGGAPLHAVETDSPRHKDEYAGPEYRRFHYCRFSLRGGALVCDVMMLQEDKSWKRVDGFECP